MDKINMELGKIIGWWSGGVTSAVACKLSIDIYGIENVRLVFIDTRNEDDDTYRFKLDCEEWYGKQIETISSDEFNSIADVWRKYKSLNVATGAICSTYLKRRVREKWQKENEYDTQVFGFDIDETKRAIAMSLNNPKAKPIYPLLMYAYSKKNCLKILKEAGIESPLMYQMGYHNNNCYKTGCVQGGIGYWQKMGVER